jgi:hypothetical protein
MGSFKCDACGHLYSSTHTFTVCPKCAGQGPADPRCTCGHFSMCFGTIRVRDSSRTNPNCPVHGTAAQSSAIQSPG